MEGLGYESYYGKRGVWSEIAEVSVLVALVEIVIVVDGLKRVANKFLSGWRYCGGGGIKFPIPSCVVVT